MLKPLKGQAKALGVRKGVTAALLASNSVAATGAGSYTVPATGWLHVWAWGAGGSGGVEAGSAGSGGGTGAACYARRKVQKGQVIPYNVGAGGVGVSGTSDGNAGGDTTVTLPGFILRAGGGRGGLRGSNAAGGVGGVAYTGDVVRPGASAAQAGTSTYTPGATPVGWDDLLTFIPNGVSSAASPFGASAAGTQPGAASGAGSTGTGDGGHGRLFFMLMSA